MHRVAKYNQDEYKEQGEVVTAGVLPPGFDQDDRETMGYFRIEIGNLLWLNTAINYDHIKLRPVFWGERQPSQLMRAQNTNNDEMGVVQNRVMYEVRCTLSQFYRYIKDMAKLRFLLIDKRNNSAFATVVVNFLLYLKQE